MRTATTTTLTTKTSGARLFIFLCFYLILDFTRFSSLVYHHAKTSSVKLSFSSLPVLFRPFPLYTNTATMLLHLAGLLRRSSRLSLLINMAFLLRQIVAGPRAQHDETGLDLCYVTSNIIVT